MAGSRQHAIVCYSTQSINAIKALAQHVTYVLHDKDKLEDGTPKKAHYHVLAYTESQMTSSAFRKAYCRSMIRLTGDKNYFNREEHDDVKCQYVKDTGDIIDYLTHCNDDKKYQYSLDDVQGDFEWWKKNCEDLRNQLKEEKEDWTLLVLESALQNKGRVPRETMVELARKHGRDFILNFSKCHQAISILLGQDFEIVDKKNERTILDKKGIPHLVDKDGVLRGVEISSDTATPFEHDSKNSPVQLKEF